MRTKLHELNDLILRLHYNHGIEVACVGGAARDTYLGKEPKDYDLVVLSQTGNLDALRDALKEETSAASVAELGEADIENYVNEGDDRGLRNVYELRMPIGDPLLFNIYEDYMTIQVLVFSEEVTKRYAGDPLNVVEDHDCDLNKAWLEPVNGRLVARVHPEFPSPFSGNVNHFQPGYSDHERKRYIASKFREFTHK